MPGPVSVKRGASPWRAADASRPCGRGRRTARAQATTGHAWIAATGAGRRRPSRAVPDRHVTGWATGRGGRVAGVQRPHVPAHTNSRPNKPAPTPYLGTPGVQPTTCRAGVSSAPQARAPQRSASTAATVRRGPRPPAATASQPPHATAAPQPMSSTRPRARSSSAVSVADQNSGPRKQRAASPRLMTPSSRSTSATAVSPAQPRAEQTAERVTDHRPMIPGRC